MAAARPGMRPASVNARRRRKSIWAFVLRSSSAAHLASASWTAGSRRNSTLLRSLIGPTPVLAYWYREPALTTCWVACSLHSTTSKLETIAALRSSSSSTTSRSSRR